MFIPLLKRGIMMVLIHHQMVSLNSCSVANPIAQHPQDKIRINHWNLNPPQIGPQTVGFDNIGLNVFVNSNVISNPQVITSFMGGVNPPQIYGESYIPAKRLIARDSSSPFHLILNTP